MLKKVLIGTAVLGVLGFGGYQAFLYSLGIYAADTVYQTSRGARLRSTRVKRGRVSASSASGELVIP